MQNILWSFSQMKAFSEDILTLQKSLWISCSFLSLISAAPRSCDAFRLLQDSSVFLKFLQLRRVPEGLGHQDFHELPSCVIRCVIGTRVQRTFFFSMWKFGKLFPKEICFVLMIPPSPPFFCYWSVDISNVQGSGNSPWLTSTILVNMCSRYPSFLLYKEN